MLTCSSFVELRGFAARARDPLEVVLDLGEDVLFDELEAGLDVDSHAGDCPRTGTVTY